MFFKTAQKGNNDWWCYLTGIILIFLAWQVLGAVPAGILAIYAFHFYGVLPLTSDFMQAYVEAGISSNLILVIIIISFLVGLVGIYVTVRFLHQKPFLSIITSRKRFDWKRVGFAVVYWGLIGLAVEYVGYLSAPEGYSFNLDWTSFIPLLLISIFLLPIQTSFEEILMRGYLLQGVGLATRSRLVSLLFTTILFGSLHLVNPEVSQYGIGIMIVHYIMMGLFLGVVTIMDDGLEQSLGIHFANNFIAATIVGIEGSVLVTDTLFKTDSYDPYTGTWSMLGAVSLYLITASIIFKWKNWKRFFVWNIEENE